MYRQNSRRKCWPPALLQQRASLAGCSQSTSRNRPGPDRCPLRLVGSSSDSPLERAGFEPSVPRSPVSSVGAARRCWLRGSGSGSARFLLLSLPFHRAGGVHSFGGLRLIARLGGLCVPAVQLKYTFAFHRLGQQFAVGQCVAEPVAHGSGCPWIIGMANVPDRSGSSNR